MKNQEDLIGLSRSAIKNQMHSLTERPPEYNMHGFVGENRLRWFLKNLSSLGNGHYPYQQYLRPEDNNGIFKMTEEENKNVSIALLGDWASDTFESHNIAHLCGIQDYSIHLGDTYYVGNEKEISDNFNSSIHAPWPYGNSGSFALLGNHEMYSGGKKYFTHLLPYMGVLKGEHTNTQEASFFCIENDYWRIIGLDTGYYSLKGLFGVKPNSKLHLHESQMNWLKDTVKPNKDKRGIILLSHHQYFSAFDEAYPVPASQLAGLFNPDQVVLWFWGHEHRLAVYGKNQLPNGTAIYCRCIGHGGMPVEIKKMPRSSDPQNTINSNLVIYDRRIRKLIDGKIDLGYNGYVLLKISANNLTAEYYDDNDNNQFGERRMIMEEKWSLDQATQKLTGISIHDHTEGKDKSLSLFAKNINQAIS